MDKPGQDDEKEIAKNKVAYETHIGSGHDPVPQKDEWVIFYDGVIVSHHFDLDKSLGELEYWFGSLPDVIQHSYIIQHGGKSVRLQHWPKKGTEKSTD
jgi:hypothetical protein